MWSESLRKIDGPCDVIDLSRDRWLVRCWFLPPGVSVVVESSVAHLQCSTKQGTKGERRELTFSTSPQGECRASRQSSPKFFSSPFPFFFLGAKPIIGLKTKFRRKKNKYRKACSIYRYHPFKGEQLIVLTYLGFQPKLHRSLLLL